jgi:6-phosphogluconolactonase
MTNDLIRYFFSATLGLAVLASVRGAVADEQLVFISSFAAGDDGAINAFVLHSEAPRLEPAERTAGVANPFFLAISPDRKFLYSIHAPEGFSGPAEEQVAAFEIVSPSGQLKKLNTQSSRGTASCYLAVDATGRTVVVANYTTGSVAALPINADGSLSEAASFVQHKGSSVDKARQEGPHAHCFVISPDNRFAYSADLGLDQVLVYALDPATAKLTPASPPFARTPQGAGPRHLTFHPQKPWMYVINEMANSVTLFDHDAESGGLKERQTISTLPDDFKGTSYCADLKITPDGRFLYGTNRGHDSIACYKIGDDGQLTLLAIESSLGAGPQNLAITAGGDMLLCANMPGNNVALFRIDPTSGKLTSLGEPVKVTSPSCIILR